MGINHCGNHGKLSCCFCGLSSMVSVPVCVYSKGNVFIIHMIFYPIQQIQTSVLWIFSTAFIRKNAVIRGILTLVLAIFHQQNFTEQWTINIY